jgi:hypothetical protein
VARLLDEQRVAAEPPAAPDGVVDDAPPRADADDEGDEPAGGR